MFITCCFPSCAEGEVASQCLWVGNVDPEISEADFKLVFEKYGPVQLIRLFPRSKCAFVTFQKPSHAIKALEMEGKQLGSMMLTLNVGKVTGQHHRDADACG